MQENLGDIRTGREALVAPKRRCSRVQSITTRPGSTFAIDGDRVIVHWVFDIEPAEGKEFALDELAYQTWRGDHIASERFYYDPGAAQAGLAKVSRVPSPRSSSWNLCYHQAEWLEALQI